MATEAIVQIRTCLDFVGGNPPIAVRRNIEPEFFGVTGITLAGSHHSLNAVLKSVALEASLHIRLNYFAWLVRKLLVTGLTSDPFF